MVQGSENFIAVTAPELIVLGDRLWIIIMSRRLQALDVVDPQRHARGHSTPLTAADANDYIDTAGPVPSYKDNPAAAERYHDELVNWFWSNYAQALGQMDNITRFDDANRRVIERIRARAFGVTLRQKAA